MTRLPGVASAAHCLYSRRPGSPVILSGVLLGPCRACWAMSSMCTAVHCCHPGMPLLDGLYSWCEHQQWARCCREHAAPAFKCLPAYKTQRLQARVQSAAFLGAVDRQQQHFC